MFVFKVNLYNTILLYRLTRILKFNNYSSITKRRNISNMFHCMCVYQLSIQVVL